MDRFLIVDKRIVGNDMSVSTKKKIVIFSAYYPPHLGGVEAYAQSLAKALTKLGLCVFVVTSQLDPSFPLNETVDDVRIIRLPSFHFMNDRFPVLKLNRALRDSWNALMEIDADYVVVNTRYYPISLFGLSYAKKKSIVPVLIDHSSGYLDSKPGLRGSLIRIYERAVTRFVRKSNPACYGVSRKSALWIASLGLRSFGVIPNSIDANEFRRNSSERNFMDEAISACNSLKVVYAGRLIPEKGVLKLIEAVKQFEYEAVPIDLFIAGSGPLQEDIGKNNDKNIHYLGALSKSDLSALLMQSNVICLPTEYPEGLPTVLLEGAACGTAVIMTDTGGAEELIPDREFGIVLPDASVGEIAKALQNVHDHQEIIQQKSTLVLQNIEQNLSWSATAKKLLKACRSAS